MKDAFQVYYLHVFELLFYLLFNQWSCFASNLDKGNSLNTFWNNTQLLALRSELFQWSNKIYVKECNLN